jgi:diphthamide synthase (EF-2-diphthine--ammonia ligase)
MPTSPKALIAWSSGKDSAWALHKVRRNGEFEIVGALTTVTDTFRRVSMHGVREGLLHAQLDAAGLRPVVIHIPFPCPNEIYEQKMAAAVTAARASGVTHMIFGDLFSRMCAPIVSASLRALASRRFSRSGVVRP